MTSLKDIIHYSVEDIFAGFSVEYEDDNVYDDEDFNEWLDENGISYGSSEYMNYDEDKGYQEFVDNHGDKMLIAYIERPNRFDTSLGSDTIYDFGDYLIKIER